jgi:hypothetical protein
MIPAVLILLYLASPSAFIPSLDPSRLWIARPGRQCLNLLFSSLELPLIISWTRRWRREITLFLMLQGVIHTPIIVLLLFGAWQVHIEGFRIECRIMYLLLFVTDDYFSFMLGLGLSRARVHSLLSVEDKDIVVLHVRRRLLLQSLKHWAFKRGVQSTLDRG